MMHEEEPPSKLGPLTVQRGKIERFHCDLQIMFMVKALVNLCNYTEHQENRATVFISAQLEIFA